MVRYLHPDRHARPHRVRDPVLLGSATGGGHRASVQSGGESCDNVSSGKRWPERTGAPQLNTPLWRMTRG